MAARVMAVIHVLDAETSIENARIASEAGAAGVFLIHMQGDDDAAIDAARRIKAEGLPRREGALHGMDWRHDRLLVGINCLSRMPTEAVAIAAEEGFDAVWEDNPGVDSKGASGLATAINGALHRSWSKHGFMPLFFGSVAFKTQAMDLDPARAALRAVDLGWIPTTSGPRTGSPPDEAKLKSMKEAIGRGQLAVASGITPSNAATLARHVDYVLAATGISADFHHLDPSLTAALVEACKQA